MSLIGLNPCNMVCAGNASEYCGGSQTLSVYKLTDEAAAANPPSTTSQTPTTLTGSLPPSTGFASPNADWTSLGCYFDLVSTRALQGTNQWGGGGSAMTNSVCINYCASKGFSMAGTEVRFHHATVATVTYDRVIVRRRMLLRGRLDWLL
jgi:hypothetical protein